MNESSHSAYVPPQPRSRSWAKQLVAIGVTAGFAACLPGCGVIELTSRQASSPQELSPPADVKYVQAHGIRFAYLEEGQGPLVLLFHGYPETARSWTAVQRHLAAAGYRVIAPYMRGYPPSGSGNDYGVPTLGQDVIALIDAFGVEQAVVVGHDWGAAAAYAAVQQQPRRISKLVALSFPHPRGVVGYPGALLDAPHFFYYQLPCAERLVWSYDFAHIERLYRDWAPNYKVPAAVLADIKDSLKVPGATSNALGYYWAVIKADPAVTLASAESQVSIPSLVISGDADVPAPPIRFEKARRAFTGRYQFVSLAGVGHFPQLEAPDRVAEAILTFIQEDASGH